MPNANYRAGVRFEREVKKFLENEGWMVLRTAGSHGPADLIATKPNEWVSFIQCKRVKTQAQADRVMKYLADHPFLPRGDHYTRMLYIYVSSTRDRIGVALG